MKGFKAHFRPHSTLCNGPLIRWTVFYYFHSGRGQNRKPQTQMDIRLSCSLHFFVSSLFSHLPAQTVNVWPQCIFDPVPSSTGLEGHRQSQSVEATFSVSDSHIQMSKDTKSVGAQSKSNKKYPTEFVLLTEKKHSLANEYRFRNPHLSWWNSFERDVPIHKLDLLASTQMADVQIPEC